MSDPDFWPPPEHHELDMDPVDRRSRHRFWWQAAIAIVLLVGMGILAYRSWYVNDDDADPALAAAVDELRQQVRGLGATPVVPPPEDIVDGGTKFVPIPGPTGPRGLEGRPGRDGRDGAPCLPTNPFCVGPKGEPGVSPPDDPDPDDPEINDPDPDDPEIQDPEIDDPPIPGPAGVSVTNIQVVEVTQNDCRLIVTLSDGKQIDAGQIDCPEPPLVPLG